MTKPLQTTSLELSKKLKELGVKQDSFTTKGQDVKETGEFLLCSAFTLDEVLDMLPNAIVNKKEPTWSHRLEIIKNEESSYEFYYAHNEDSWIEHKNPAEAAGQLLAWCIENGYVKVK